MSLKPFKLARVTFEEYKQWCKDNKKSFSKSEVKKEFFDKITNGKLVRDESGKIIKR